MAGCSGSDDPTAARGRSRGPPPPARTRWATADPREPEHPAPEQRRAFDVVGGSSNSSGSSGSLRPWRSRTIGRHRGSSSVVRHQDDQAVAAGHTIGPARWQDRRPTGSFERMAGRFARSRPAAEPAVSCSGYCLSCRARTSWTIAGTAGEPGSDTAAAPAQNRRFWGHRREYAMTCAETTSHRFSRDGDAGVVVDRDRYPRKCVMTNSSLRTL